MPISRNQLHLSKIDEFAAFCATLGYVREYEPKNEYLVLRMRKPGEQPVKYYQRNRGDHATIPYEPRAAYRLFRKFIDHVQAAAVPCPERKKPRKQCAKCPWKVSTDPHDIPNGYCPDKHRNLRNTIAEPGRIAVGGTLRVMACHESPVGREQPCVGWLANQLGPGNNMALRLAAWSKQLDVDFELDGEQHARLEDTFP